MANAVGEASAASRAATAPDECPTSNGRASPPAIVSMSAASVAIECGSAIDASGV